MKRYWVIFLLAVTSLPSHAADPFDDIFDIDDLRVKITPSMPYVTVLHHGEEVVVMRHQNPDNTVASRFAVTGRDCPPFCIQPIEVHPEVKTIGELELIDYLRRRSAGDDEILVIDARTAEWVASGTIPGSVNIPWSRLDPSQADPADIAEILRFDFAAIANDELWDFSGAKTLVFFCNGAWCGQAPTNIRALLTLGYPPEKLKWYRGGMQSWEQFGFTTVTDPAVDH